MHLLWRWYRSYPPRRSAHAVLTLTCRPAVRLAVTSDRYVSSGQGQGPRGTLHEDSRAGGGRYDQESGEGLRAGEPQPLRPLQLLQPFGEGLRAGEPQPLRPLQLLQPLRRAEHARRDTPAREQRPVIASSPASPLPSSPLRPRSPLSSSLTIPQAEETAAKYQQRIEDERKAREEAAKVPRLTRTPTLTPSPKKRL